jgi:crotonobetainyl-CoA:carnitine CoA-transferase CaiB-like acyl-CoA transferase
VIVCEPPPSGSGLRRLGPPAVQAVWWRVIARNKRSLAIDCSQAGALPVLRRLAEQADLVARDECAAGTRLREVMADAPRAVDMHLFPTGADRPDLWHPWSTRPEFAAAASGMMALTGEPDGPAVQPEMPLADYCAGMMALSLALAELRAARRSERAPAPVRMALHEALHRMNEWNVVVAAAQGVAERRNGNRFPMNANIGNVFRTRDGKLLTVSAATPSVADRLLQMIGGGELRDDPRFRTPADRRLHMDDLDRVVAQWIGERDAEDAMRLVRENDVVVGPICDADDVFAHAHIRERGNIVQAGGDSPPGLAMPAALPLVSPVAGAVQHAGPAAGADSDEVLTQLGFTAAETQRLRREGVIWR